MNPLCDAALYRSAPAYHTAVSTAKPEQHSFCAAQIIASFGVKLAYGVKIAGNHCKQKARNFSVYQEVSGFVLLKLELVGARPLHLAGARPLGRLKAPHWGFHCCANAEFTAQSASSWGVGAGISRRVFAKHQVS